MNQTFTYAQQELNRYFRQITNQDASSIVLVIDSSHPSLAGCAASPFDDAYVINITAGDGQIVGISPRALLLGVYKYLTLLGCCFYAPGKGGEYISKRCIADCSAAYTGIASLRHRGICIEGAVSLENVLDMVDWLPKNGFNSYFIQFREGHTFFERWYTHEGSTCLAPQPYSVEDSRRYVAQIEEELQKRSLIYHKIGHGWTCECLGYPSTGWHTVDSQQIPEGLREYLAEVNGERRFFGDIPLNTHLCYSNATARDKLVSEIVQYALINTQVSVLHFWLADNFNNICECEECRKKTQSDWYVMLLNEIDARLTALGLETRIVFLIYFELLWPPIDEELLNPDRFILMFAPITRTYTQPFYTADESVESQNPLPLDAYQQNNVVYPESVKANLNYLYQWQKHFPGDSFDFDYHLMWDIYKEHSGLRLARIIYDDCIRLKDMGLNGLMSCQLGRTTFPTALCMYVMGQTLFDTGVSFDTLTQQYFASAYGKSAPLAYEYIQNLSVKFSHEYVRSEPEGLSSEDYVSRFTDAKKYIEQFVPVLHQAAEDAQNTPYTRMWNVLAISADIHRQLANALIEKANGVPEDRLKELAQKIREQVSAIEMNIQSDIDIKYYNMLVGGFIEQPLQNV